jgi:hypothetical protein
MDATLLSAKPWKILKVWQTNQFELVLQLAFAGVPARDLPLKKFFATLDTKQNSFGLRLAASKPEFHRQENAFVQLWRKHFRSVLLWDIVANQQNGDLWLILIEGRQSEPAGFIKLAKSRPPEMQLINQAHEILVRHGSKGTFTKRQRLAEPAPHLEPQPPWQSAKRQLLADLLPESTAGASDAVPQNDGHSEETPPSAEQETLSGEQRSLLQKLKRRRKTARKAYEKQIQAIPSAEEVQRHERQAHLLQSFAYLVRDEATELTIPPDLSGDPEPYTIPLEPEQSLGANIEEAFKEAKKIRRAREVGNKRQEQNQRQLQQLDDDIVYLSQNPLSTHDLTSYYSRYKLTPPTTSDQRSKGKSKESDIAKPYKVFQASSGHLIFVGKGPQENDQLTKAAKPKDYWIHAAGVAGSHVIIPAAKDIRDQLPEKLLTEAAILALHFSKLKENLAGETYVARKHEIKKRKGMPAGLWNVERCKTRFFRYSKDDLAAILNRMQP